MFHQYHIYYVDMFDIDGILTVHMLLRGNKNRSKKLIKVKDTNYLHVA